MVITLKKGVSSNVILTSPLIGISGSHTFFSLEPGSYLVTLTDDVNGCSKITGVSIQEPSNSFSANLTQNSTTFTTTATGGWGDEPPNNPAPNNEYIYTWEYNLGTGWLPVTQTPTNTYSNGVGTSVLNLTSTGYQLRCAVKAQNNTGSFCQQFTNPITV